MPSESIFQVAVVELECGHEAESWGGVRARCIECKRLGWKERCGACNGFHAVAPDPRCPTCLRLGPRSDVLHSCPDCYEPRGGKR